MKVVKVSPNMGAVHAVYTEARAKEYALTGCTYLVDQTRTPNEFVPWEDQAKANPTTGKFRRNHFKTEEKEPAMAKLFTFNMRDKDYFGTHIGTTSNGDWVMEAKGEAAPFVVPKKDVTEVLPYSVSMTYLNNAGKEYHFKANQEDGLREGNIVMDNSGTLMRVKAIDTKSSRATAWLEGTVIVGKTLIGDA